jgi:hypothetical protein
MPTSSLALRIPARAEFLDPETPGHRIGFGTGVSIPYAGRVGRLLTQLQITAGDLPRSWTIGATLRIGMPGGSRRYFCTGNRPASDPEWVPRSASHFAAREEARRRTGDGREFEEICPGEIAACSEMCSEKSSDDAQRRFLGSRSDRRTGGGIGADFWLSPVAEPSPGKIGGQVIPRRAGAPPCPSNSADNTAWRGEPWTSARPRSCR